MRKGRFSVHRLQSLRRGWQVLTQHLGPACGCHWSRGFVGLQFRCEIYVDDPLWTLEVPSRKGHAPSQLRCWPLPSWVSLSLVTKPVSVTEWIGAQLSVEDSNISVAMPKDKVDALHGETSRFLSAAVAQKKDIQSFCGQLSLVAGVVPTLWPFVDTWSEWCWPQARACRWNSSAVGASGWRFGGSSRVQLVTPAPHTACHPGTRGFIAFLCGLVKLHQSPRVLHHLPPPVAPALQRTPAHADGTTVAGKRRVQAFSA